MFWVPGTVAATITESTTMNDTMPTTTGADIIQLLEDDTTAMLSTQPPPLPPSLPEHLQQQQQLLIQSATTITEELTPSGVDDIMQTSEAIFSSRKDTTFAYTSTVITTNRPSKSIL